MSAGVLIFGHQVLDPGGDGGGAAVERTLHVGDAIQVSGVTVRLTSVEMVSGS